MGYKTTVGCVYTEVSRLVVHKNVKFVPVCTRFLVSSVVGSKVQVTQSCETISEQCFLGWMVLFQSHCMKASYASVNRFQIYMDNQPEILNLHTPKNSWKVMLYVCMRTGSLSKSV